MLTWGMISDRVGLSNLQRNCDAHGRQFGTQVTKYIWDRHHIHVAPLSRGTEHTCSRYGHCDFRAGCFVRILTQCSSCPLAFFLGSGTAYSTIFATGTCCFHSVGRRSLSQAEIVVAQRNNATACPTHPCSRVVGAVHQTIL